MRFFSSLVPSLLLVGAGVAQAASGWGFEDATVSVTTKGAGVGAGSKDKYVILPEGAIAAPRIQSCN